MNLADDKGGGVSPLPYRLKFIGYGATVDEMADSMKACIQSGVPEIKKNSREGLRLAVVGGGPSVIEHLDELFGWDGEVWAINGAASLMRKENILHYAFSVDPNPGLEKHLEGSERAILASCCRPEVFDCFNGRVEMFHLDTFGGKEHGLRVSGGATTAARAHLLAPWCGFTEVHYFGCEGCVPMKGKTHAYMDNPDDDAVIVKAGGKTFKAHADHIMQCEVLSEIMREFPQYYKNRSGGLLQAMIENKDTWEMVALSRSLMENIGALEHA